MAKTKQGRCQQIESFEDDLSQCMGCGFRTFSCPVYQEEQAESSVAEART